MKTSPPSRFNTKLYKDNIVKFKRHQIDTYKMEERFVSLSAFIDSNCDILILSEEIITDILEYSSISTDAPYKFTSLSYSKQAKLTIEQFILDFYEATQKKITHFLVINYIINKVLPPPTS